jgi:UDP-glucose 4-epimerase
MNGALPVILGAGGFMGRRLTRALLERGHAVRLFDRSYGADYLNTMERFQGRFELIEGNLESPADREKAIRGASAVFHLISSSVPITSPLWLDVEIKVNLPNTLSILHTMLRNGIKRIIYPSSGGAIYGESGSDKSKESGPLNPIGAYGMGKLLVEETLRYYRRTCGLKDLIVRISNAYGGSERTTSCQGAVDVFLRRHAEGKAIPLWGDGATVRDYIHIDDIVQALVLLYEQDVHAIEVNLGSGVGHSLMEVISIIENVSGVPVKIERREGMYTGLKRNVLDTELLKQIVGYGAKISLEDGISRCWSALTSSRNGAASMVPIVVFQDGDAWHQPNSIRPA